MQNGKQTIIANNLTSSNNQMLKKMWANISTTYNLISLSVSAAEPL